MTKPTDYDVLKSATEQIEKSEFMPSLIIIDIEDIKMCMPQLTDENITLIKLWIDEAYENGYEKGARNNLEN